MFVFVYFKMVIVVVLCIYTLKIITTWRSDDTLWVVARCGLKRGRCQRYQWHVKEARGIN